MNEARIKLAEAMGWREAAIGSWYPKDKPFVDAQSQPPDPFTDANDDYAVLEWARDKDKEFALKFRDALAELRVYEWDGETRSLSAQSGRYKIGDYAEAACKVLEI